MFKDIYLIFNPVSGQGDPVSELAIIQSIIDEKTEGKANLTVLETTPSQAADQLAKIAVENGADCVIASGGDGTVSAVAGALIERPIPLGIVPRGNRECDRCRLRYFQ